jgi:hypothetical protein
VGSRQLSDLQSPRKVWYVLGQGRSRGEVNSPGGAPHLSQRVWARPTPGQGPYFYHLSGIPVDLRSAGRQSGCRVISRQKASFWTCSEARHSSLSTAMPLGDHLPSQPSSGLGSTSPMARGGEFGQGSPRDEPFVSKLHSVRTESEAGGSCL